MAIFQSDFKSRGWKRRLEKGTISIILVRQTFLLNQADDLSLSRDARHETAMANLSSPFKNWLSGPSRWCWLAPFLFVFLVPCLFGSIAVSDEIDDAIGILKKVEANNEGNQKAIDAVKAIQSGRPTTLLRVLEGMNGASPVGKNYLSGAAGTLFQRNSLYVRSQLESFLQDQKQDGEARYLVFEWLTENQPQLREEMLTTFREDSSLELRYAAISQALKNLEKSDKIEAFQELLDLARHPSQIEDISKKLKELGRPVDQAKVFGFLMSWQVIGPFDNKEQKHFHTVYEVEKDLLADDSFDSSKKYPGKSGEVGWQETTTKDPAGIVELAELYNKEKGAIAYARTVFKAEKALDVEMRLGCINANKLWVNNREVFMNEVYHAGMSIDQYIGRVRLNPGDNEIVLKICQNEQTESWAQRWQFQLRVSDFTGKAIVADIR